VAVHVYKVAVFAALAPLEEKEEGDVAAAAAGCQRGNCWSNVGQRQLRQVRLGRNVSKSAEFL
jgi:hypothetical protein